MKELLESYLESNSIVKHQIDSYNRFISKGLKEILELNSVITPNIPDYSIKLLDIRVEKPVVIEPDSSTRAILPNEALIRGLTYAAPIYLKYVPMIKGIPKEVDIKETFIGEIPVMVKSNLCYTSNMTEEQLVENGEDPYDPGGYFIIKGTERTLIAVEDVAQNKIMVAKEKGNYVARVFSSIEGFKSKCTVTRDENGIFKVLFPGVESSIDLILLLRALGMSKDDMLNSVSDEYTYNDILVNLDSSEASDANIEEVYDMLAKQVYAGQNKEYKQKRIKKELDEYLLPHIGLSEDARKEKARFLLLMAARASLAYHHKIKPDDKDHFKNKRLRLAGDLLFDLFLHSFKLFLRDVKYHIERNVMRERKANFNIAVNPDALTDRILSAMGTGNWPNGPSGISQVLDRINFISSLAHLRRVKSPLAKRRTNFKARDVHGTQIGKICISETPEGIEVGLTKYLAIMARVTDDVDASIVLNKIKDIKGFKVNEYYLHNINEKRLIDESDTYGKQ
ncbi:MAG: DNA-directed RNA polymerase subunit B'' [Candidatus Micrarchaeota archaeon]|nr:MAG: DNA-directed RNA polymerase subunit B'' [Candidatus Micrarchaeota archaeon]